MTSARKSERPIFEQAHTFLADMLGQARALAALYASAATGRLTGNIRAPKIVIAEGAMFKGNSDMSGKKDERKDKAAVS